MKEKLEQRLEELRREYRQGEKMLADLQKQEAELRETMLRISGAVQVLEESLRGPEAEAERPIVAEMQADGT